MSQFHRADARRDARWAWDGPGREVWPLLLLQASAPLSGVLWLSVVSEFMYIGLLATGFLLMWVEAVCLCAKREMNALKVNAFAAMCTVLSGGNAVGGRGFRGESFRVGGPKGDLLFSFVFVSF